jgi:hypothetical protein
VRQAAEDLLEEPAEGGRARGLSAPS